MNLKWMALEMGEPSAGVRHDRRTLLESLADLKSAIRRSVGFETEEKSGPQPKLERWKVNTIDRFRKTIFKSIHKLKPNGTVNFENWGKLIGLLERYKTFLRTDLPRIVRQEGFDQVPDGKWEEIQPTSQLRSALIKILNRPVSANEQLDKLVDEAAELQIAKLDKQREAAFAIVGQQSAKVVSKFFRGIERGYSLFMDEEAKFCGDRGRTDIYMVLLVAEHEIEKMRRTLPAMGDEPLYKHLETWYRFPFKDEKKNRRWFRDVLDDISLYIKGSRGRPHTVLSVGNTS